MMNKSIGVIRRQTTAMSLVPDGIAVTEAFASAIVSRYRAQTVLACSADLALAWEPPAQIDYFQAAPQITIAPSITVQHQTIFAAVKKDVVAPPAERTIIERLLSRQIRIASFTPSQSAERPAASHSANDFKAVLTNPAETQHVERIVPSSAAVKDASTSPEPMPFAKANARDLDWGSKPILTPEPKAFTLPAPEMKRVADQVMREIDHRITAQRERLGRR